MSLSCRLLPYQVGDGVGNMADDEALLSSAAEQGRASLRFYGWSVPTLSLGYFQPHGPARAYPGLGELPWLRRPSGGAALVHHHELTYALALPPGRPWQGGEPWLGRFHRLIAAALAELGVQTSLCPPEGERKLGEVLCFRHHTPGDLLLAGHKVVGSAQRKARGALLQHGGLLLAQSPHTPELPGLAELAGLRLDPAELADRIARQLAGDAGWRIEPGAWTPAEREASRDLRWTRYSSPQWNERR